MTLAVATPPSSAPMRMTIEEFDLLPDRKRYELVHGIKVERKVGTESDLIGATIAFVLQNFNRVAKLGYVFGENDYAYDPVDRNHFRRPDVSFVAKTRFPGGKIPTARARFAPDLAVEVISPFDLAADVNEKVTEYKRARVRLIWVVFPSSRMVDVYCSDGRVYGLDIDQTITGEDVLPGFSSRVAEFFPEILGDTSDSTPAAQNPQ